MPCSLLRQLHGAEILELFEGAGATFLRVNAALLIAALWTIPVGVAIGFHPAPGAHRAAAGADRRVRTGDGALSCPADRAGPRRRRTRHRLHRADAAGHAVVHPVQRDRRRHVDSLGPERGLRTLPLQAWQRWKTLILPGIFPYLITGMVTASGGAWNASIIAEYFHLNGQTLSTLGLGAEISRATDHGQFDMLLLATIIMALMVVTINRLVWRPLFHLAETKYRLEG